MNKKFIISAVITFLAAIVGYSLYRNRAKTSNLHIVSTPQQAHSRVSSDEQKTASSPLLPAIEAQKEQIVPVDDKKITTTRTYVTSDQIPRSEYSLIIKTGNVRTFGKVVKGLGLSPEDQTKLMDFLNERGEVYRDYRSEVAAHPGLAESEYHAALEQGYATVDGEMKAAFGTEKFSQIMDMIKSSPYLAQINDRYDPYLTAAGHSLAPEQIFPVAMEMANGYGIRGSADTSPTLSNVDPISGLTPVDRTVLNSLTPILTPEQFELLKQVLAKKNAEYLVLLRAQNNP